jgi:hypothetical protein
MTTPHEKAGTLQSFGYILTEVTMLASLLYCLETLQYTKLYLILILPVFATIATVLALLHTGAWFNTAIALLIVTAVSELAYAITLLATYPSESVEMQIADQLFGFYVLIGFLAVQIILFIWSTVLMFQIRSFKPFQRLAARRTDGADTQYIANTMIGLTCAYATVLVLSSLLNFVHALEWTGFYIALALPYGIPYLMVMQLFKIGKSIVVGNFMICSVAAIDLIYTVWLLVSYNVQLPDLQAESFGVAGFWLLYVSFIVRIVITIWFAILSSRLMDTPFYPRFSRFLQDKTL